MAVRWRDKIKAHKNLIFILLLAILTLHVILPQLSDLRDILKSVKAADIYWVLLSIFVFFLSVPLTTLNYMALSLKPIAFGLTFRVQMAVLFVAKLLPQGVGAIGLNMYYLIKKGHTTSQAATVMTIDGITSAVAYMIMLVAVLLIGPISLKGLQGGANISFNLGYLLVVILLGIAYYLYRSVSMRQRIKKTWKDLIGNLALYKENPLRVLAGCAYNGLSSFTSVFTLWASAQAFGFHLSIAGALVAVTLGNIAATLIPTPGGIGAVEAGIYAGLVLVGMEGPDATLVTLLYRLITYWIPIIPGAFYFLRLRKNLLAGYKVKGGLKT